MITAARTIGILLVSLAAGCGGVTETPLDPSALTSRLRDTPAIGAVTRLALRNQADDLLKQFGAYHESGRETGVETLRQPYNMLVLKGLSIIQDGDPSLAFAIARSREAIWDILSDPEKFKSATVNRGEVP